MNKRVLKESLFGAISIVALFICAVLYALPDEQYGDLLNGFRGIIIITLYMGSIAIWVVSVYERIINTNVRKYIILICGMMGLWMLARTLKNSFLCDMGVFSRILWYFYYVPMIHIPMFGLAAAVSIDNKEDKKIAKIIQMLFHFSGLLMLLIMTNEFHGLAFRIVYDESGNWQGDYTHGPLYYVVTIWIMMVTVAMLVVLYQKCSIRTSKRLIWFPAGIIVLGLAFAAICAYDTSPSMGDIEASAMLCAINMALWESVIQIGLVNSNSRYDEIMKCSTASLIITNSGYKMYAKSDSARMIPDDMLVKASKGNCMLDEDTRLKSARIKGGFVFWQEDISELNRVLDELKIARKRLSENNDLLVAEVDVKKRQAAVDIQNNLYDTIADELSGELDKLDMMLKNRPENDRAALDRLLADACLCGAYIKRRSNLIILGHDNSVVPINELKLCIEESLRYLELCGVESSLRMIGNGDIDIDQAKKVYDSFEEEIEKNYQEIESVGVEIKRRQAGVSLLMRYNKDGSGGEFECSF